MRHIKLNSDYNNAYVTSKHEQYTHVKIYIYYKLKLNNKNIIHVCACNMKGKLAYI